MENKTDFALSYCGSRDPNIKITRCVVASKQKTAKARQKAT